MGFVKHLTSVLIDQPIKNVGTIKTFTFKPAAEGAVIWEIEFSDQRGVCPFGNAY